MNYLPEVMMTDPLSLTGDLAWIGFVLEVRLGASPCSLNPNTGGQGVKPRKKN